MISGVVVKDLVVHEDERGWVMELLRCDDEFYEAFGQVYVTVAYPGVVKAWHAHRMQTDHFAVVSGKAKVALYDAREGSPTQGRVDDFVLSREEPKLVRIPTEVYHGFMALGDEPAYVINTPDKPYNRNNPDELRIPWDSGEIPYTWK